MPLDRTRPYGEIIGATNRARYSQDGKEYDFAGDEIGVLDDPVVEGIEDSQFMPAMPFRRGPGRPRKDRTE